jgi:hypothetical protein
MMNALKLSTDNSNQFVPFTAFVDNTRLSPSSASTFDHICIDHAIHGILDSIIQQDPYPEEILTETPSDENFSSEDVFILHDLLLDPRWTSSSFNAPMPNVIIEQHTSAPQIAAQELYCAYEDCMNLARSKGVCKAHGGGRRCVEPGCTKSSQSRGRCIRHGGGRRCSIEGCNKGAQSTGRCKAHGGGVRCKVPGCGKSSQGSGLCRTHGGGKLCIHPGCKKGTQRRGLCSTHGGARICVVEGCTRVDRGGGRCGRHTLKKNL